MVAAMEILCKNREDRRDGVSFVVGMDSIMEAISHSHI